MGFLKLIRIGAVVLAVYLAFKLPRRAGVRSQVQQDARRQGRKFVQSKEVNDASKSQNG